VLKQTVNGDIKWWNTPIEVPKYLPPHSDLQKAIDLLKSAKRPLLIVGKGAAYSGASK
jgi:thiamine pyrophosphate-dependent acetolactate synthase large subunit-like protein